MSKFMECSISRCMYKGKERINRVVNLDMCNWFQKGEKDFYQLIFKTNVESINNTGIVVWNYGNDEVAQKRLETDYNWALNNGS